MYTKWFIYLLMMFTLLIGCQQNSENSLPNQKTDENNRFTQVKTSSPETPKDLSNTEIANHLANVANSVPSVNNATAIVAGPYAVVGIDIDKELDRSRVGTIKYTVSEALYHDPYGKTAVVVADADVMERLRIMGRSIQEGRPVQGVVEELAAIVGRYMPDFPIIDDRPHKPDQNNEIIDNEEEQELENIQQNQSKHYTD